MSTRFQPRGSRSYLAVTTHGSTIPGGAPCSSSPGLHPRVDHPASSAMEPRAAVLIGSRKIRKHGQPSEGVVSPRCGLGGNADRASHRTLTRFTVAPLPERRLWVLRRGTPADTERQGVERSGAAPKPAIHRHVEEACSLTIPSTQVRQGAERARTSATQPLASGCRWAFVGPSYIAPSRSPDQPPMAEDECHSA